MMAKTSLKALREANACVDSYNRLVRTLQGLPFSQEDGDRATYIHFNHDGEIPLRVILDSNGLDDALWSLRACEQTPEMVRQERLYAVWCARQVQHLMNDPRSITALDVAERFAYGEATAEQLYAAWAAAWAARDAAWAAYWDAAWAARDARDARDAAWAARDAQKQQFILMFCEEQAPCT